MSAAYVCDCGNKIDATLVEDTWAGPKGIVTTYPAQVVCESDEHPSPMQMKRQEAE